MPILINASLRSQLNLNISSKKLKGLQKLDVKSVNNRDSSHLDKTLVTTKNQTKRVAIKALKINVTNQSIDKLVQQQTLARYEELADIEHNMQYSLKRLAAKAGLFSDIKTLSDLRETVETELGSAVLSYLSIKLPMLQGDGKLSVGFVEQCCELVNSDMIEGFKVAYNLTKLNKHSPVNEQARIRVASELAKLPLDLLSNAAKHDLTVIVTHDNVTTYLTDLKGCGARGHENSTWDSLPGVGAFGGSNETIIAMSKDLNSGLWRPAENHGSANLVIHEFGHSIDRIVGTEEHGAYLSKGGDFYRSWYADFNLLGNQYYQQAGVDNSYGAGLEESFAEGLARTYGSDNGFSSWASIEKYLKQAFE